MNPSAMVAPLSTYERLVTRAGSGKACGFSGAEGADDHSCTAAERDLWSSLLVTNERSTAALLGAAGVSIDITAPRDLIAQNDTVPVTVRVYNGGKSTLTLDRVSLINALGMASRQRREILPDSSATQQITYRAPMRLSLPWWLRSAPQGDMFVQPRADMIEGEDRRLESGAEVGLRVDGVPVLVREGPIVYRFADPARGEVRRPIATVPEISVLLQHEVEYARAGAPFDRTMLVYVHSAAGVPRQVDVTLAVAGRAPRRHGDAARVARAVRRRAPLFPGAGRARRRAPRHLGEREPARECRGACFEPGVRACRVLAHPAAYASTAARRSHSKRSTSPTPTSRSGISGAWVTTSCRCSRSSAFRSGSSIRSRSRNKNLERLHGHRHRAARVRVESGARRQQRHADGVRAQRRNDRRAVRTGLVRAAGNLSVPDHGAALDRSSDRRECVGSRPGSGFAASREAEQDRAREISRTGFRSARCTCRARSTPCIAPCSR